MKKKTLRSTKFEPAPVFPKAEPFLFKRFYIKL